MGMESAENTLKVRVGLYQSLRVDCESSQPLATTARARVRGKSLKRGREREEEGRGGGKERRRERRKDRDKLKVPVAKRIEENPVEGEKLLS